jgi:cytidine deaminase
MMARRPRRLTEFQPSPRPAPVGAADEGLPLTEADHALIQAARQVLVRHHKPFWHTVAAAIRSRDGRIWTGIHLGATVGRLSICAEAIALGRAVLDGDGSIDTAVAVRHHKPEEPIQDIAVVSPCGACREMITDYSPQALVIVPGPAGLLKLPIRTMLPLPYQR